MSFQTLKIKNILMIMLFLTTSSIFAKSYYNVTNHGVTDDGEGNVYWNIIVKNYTEGKLKINVSEKDNKDGNLKIDGVNKVDGKSEIHTRIEWKVRNKANLTTGVEFKFKKHVVVTGILYLWEKK